MPHKKQSKKKNWLIPSKWGGLWQFLWEDNSLLSWVVNVLLAFILIKFLLYPGLGLMFATDYPIVAVVSSSMEHPQGSDFWWDTQAICNKQYCTQEEYYSKIEETSKSEFKEYPFSSGFNKGDIMVLAGEKPKDIKKGDVLVFKSNRADPIIHRVMEIWYEDDSYHYRTKGDNNPRSYPEIMETDISDDRIVGKAVFRVPYLGWVKLAFVGIINVFR